MKEYKDRPTCAKFNAGTPVSAKEFHNGAEDFYLDVVDPMINKEQATEYPDFWGNVWAKRNKPLEELSPDQERLKRPTELKNGVTRFIQVPTDELISALREFEKRVYE